MAINQKTLTRIADGLKKFQPLLSSAKSRDINESDTVVLLFGVLADILGYDRYTEITTEKAVKNNYCDLAIKIDGKITILIEAKAIGVELKDVHIHQAVSYAANDGIDWAILTNGINWKIYKVLFTKPIQNILVTEFDFLSLKPKDKSDIEKLALLCREATCKSSLDEYYTQRQATSKFMLGNLLLEEGVVNQLKKELRQVYPNIKTTNEELIKILTNEVLKREIVEGEEAIEAKKKIVKANKKIEKNKADKPKAAASPEAELLIENHSSENSDT